MSVTAYIYIHKLILRIRIWSAKTTATSNTDHGEKDVRSVFAAAAYTA